MHRSSFHQRAQDKARGSGGIADLARSTTFGRCSQTCPEIWSEPNLHALHAMRKEACVRPLHNASALHVDCPVRSRAWATTATRRYWRTSSAGTAWTAGERRTCPNPPFCPTLKPRTPNDETAGGFGVYLSQPGHCKKGCNDLQRYFSGILRQLVLCACVASTGSCALSTRTTLCAECRRRK